MKKIVILSLLLLNLTGCRQITTKTTKETSDSIENYQLYESFSADLIAPETVSSITSEPIQPDHTSTE